MLQRVQTLLLLGTAICMTLVFFFPSWQEYNEAHTQKIVLDAVSLDQINLESDQTTESSQTVVIAILAALSIATTFYSIFRYDNRLTQIKLNALNAFLMAACVGAQFIYSMNAEDIINPEQQGEYDLAFFLPLIAMIFNVIANRFIRKDEKLVRDADRMR